MQETWQGTLKNQLENQYVQESLGWVEINVSTAGLLNLTIVSDRFADLSVPQRKEQFDDLRATTVTNTGGSLWSVFSRETQE